MAQQMTLTVAGTDIVQRISQRLAPITGTTLAVAVPAANGGPPSQIVWQENGDSVLLHIDSLKARFTGGWLLCALDLESDQSDRQNVQFLYYLGGDASSGTNAAAVVNAPIAAAAPVAERWGTAVQRVIWDAVLDALDAAVFKAGTQAPNQKLTLGGYFATDAGLQATVFAGEL